MWTDLDIRIEECRVKRLVAEERFRIQLFQFQVELELFLLQARVWAATHIETKFQSYVRFCNLPFDQTPEAPDDSGVVEIPGVMLDGNFTIEDMDVIRAELSKKEVITNDSKRKGGSET